MPLTPSTLSSGLQGLSQTDKFPPVIDQLVKSFDDYWRLATVSGVPVSGTTEPGKAAMKAVLTSISATNGAPVAIASGITSYWTTMAPLAPSLWVVPGFTVLAPITPPPGLSGLQAAILGAFNANVGARAELEQASDVLAAAIHPTQLGATVTLQPTVGAPVVTPIL